MTRWTMEDVARAVRGNPALQARNPGLLYEGTGPQLGPMLPEVTSPLRASPWWKTRGFASGLEARYVEEVLVPLQEAGEIFGFWYEPWKLKLAPGAYYTPDFLLVYPSARLAFHEVKGFWREAARVRIKVAASTYPFVQFSGVQLRQGVWTYEAFPARERGQHGYDIASRSAGSGNALECE